MIILRNSPVHPRGPPFYHLIYGLLAILPLNLVLFESLYYLQIELILDAV